MRRTHNEIGLCDRNDEASNLPFGLCQRHSFSQRTSLVDVGWAVLITAQIRWCDAVYDVTRRKAGQHVCMQPHHQSKKRDGAKTRRTHRNKTDFWN